MTDVRVRNNVVVRGGGARTIVFGHGFGCDQTMWRLVAPAFEEAHRVVLFDFVGAGRSDRGAYDPRRYATLDGYAKDLLEVCRALDLRDVVYVGHSVGATFGLLAAIEDPSLFERMVLVCPSPRFVNDPPDYVGGFERADVEGLLALMDQNFMGWGMALSQQVAADAAIARDLRESFCSTDPLVLRELARATFLADCRDVLPRVDVPCLVAQCARDDMAPVAVGEYVARRLPRGTYRLLDASGHMPHVSDPALVIDAIGAYLESRRAA